MSRFTGMTSAVAEFLATRVFCLLDDPVDDSQRISAGDFGLWVKDLPSHFSAISPTGHRRKVSTSSIHGYPIALSTPQSRRPSSRPPSVNQLSRAPANSRPISRAPSVGPSGDLGIQLLSPIDMNVESGVSANDEVDEVEDGRESRSASKRRKRGVRGRNATPSSPRTTDPSHNLENLASASQSLARDLSKVGRSQSRSKPELVRPESFLNSPVVIAIPATSPSPVARPQIVKKPSKWKLSFGKSSTSEDKDDSGIAKAAVVSSILSTLQPSSAVNNGVLHHDLSLSFSDQRGRRIGAPTTVPARPPRRSSPPSMYGGLLQENWTAGTDSKRGISPLPTRRGKSPAASVLTTKSMPSTPSSPATVSKQSENWRSSMATTASAMTSTTTFTRFSNASARSVATQATSVSASSWRSPVSKPIPVSPPPKPVEIRPRVMPSNVKGEDALVSVPFRAKS